MIQINTRPIDILKPLIEEAYDFAAKMPGRFFSPNHQHAIEETVGLINRGKVRIAQPARDRWETQVWLKQAILLYFRLRYVEEMALGPFQWTDKIPIKQWTLDMEVRAVPPATVRFGAYVAKSCVLMPCYVNIGAYVDEGTMVDTWATVGSCAQVGKNVHLSGGVGLGGVLEPAQAAPVIIEDDCFIGSRCIVVEGVRVRRGAVLGAGVVLTQSTPIVDTRGSVPKITKGEVPENSVVIPGTLPKRFPAGEFQVPCALIIGERSASTDRKTSLNQVLREFEVPV
ncbi:MAG: 2,3,4,5-tetrahydropyridine-2,6-dicarboxylate N-succinyltransferase [Bdellovibrionales bacterium]